MKTRILHTRFWEDSYISQLKADEQLAFVYLLTNPRVNLCGIYELPDSQIFLPISKERWQSIKEKFMADKKFIFIDGWVRIVNYEKYNCYTGEKNIVAREKELLQVKKEILEYPIDTVSIDYRYPSDSLSNQKSVISNQKPVVTVLSNFSSIKWEEFLNDNEFKNKDVELAYKTARDWLASSGKRYKDYKAFFRNWLRRTPDKMKTIREYELPSPRVEEINQENLDKFQEMKKQIFKTI